MTIYSSLEEMVEDAANAAGHPFYISYRGKDYYTFAKSDEEAAFAVASEMGMKIEQVPFNELYSLIRGGKKPAKKAASKPAAAKTDSDGNKDQEDRPEIPNLGGYTLKGLRDLAKSRKITIPADLKEVPAVAVHILAEAEKRGMTISDGQTPF